MKSPIAWIIAAMLLGAAVFLAVNRQAPKQRPHVILISLDTLRWDGVGVFSGAAPSPTPAIDALAQDCIAFPNAYAPMPLTLSSHMSMLTGLYPDVHGVTGSESVLSDEVPTLGEILKDQGYETVGIFNSPWLKAGFGFGRGFDHYQRIPHILTQAEANNRQALRLLRQRTDPKAPLFLFLHYFSVHSDALEGHPPYNAPPGFRIPEYERASDHFCTADGECATQFLLAAGRSAEALPPEDIDLLVSLYESGIRYTDHAIGQLIAGLRELGLYENSLLIVVSDHGEEFQDHGELLHTQIFEECSRVPFLMKLPRGERGGTVSEDVIEVMDIFPTVLSALDLPQPKFVQGDAIGPFGEETAGGALMQHKLHRNRYALRQRDHKLFHDLDSGESRLFDLSEDPEERRDVARAFPQVVETMTADLQALVQENRVLASALQSLEQGGVLSEEDRERLRSLGYLH